MIVICLQCGLWERVPDGVPMAALDVLMPNSICRRAPVINRICTGNHKWAILKGAR